MTPNPELWKSFPKVELASRFEISNIGRVRDSTSLKILPQRPPKKLRSGWRYRWRGFARVKIDDAWYPIHICVLTAFDRPRPPGLIARHINDDRTDNRWPENLAWGTAAENAQDRTRNTPKRPPLYFR